MDTITFQNVVVPAFKFAMAMGTSFRHRNCFSPNNITSVDLAAGDGVGGPMKRMQKSTFSPKAAKYVLHWQVF
jgi:hypothetical protein